MAQIRKKAEHIKLNQWFATAISGNDILSSSLYVSGIAILYAGIWAPLVLLIIGIVLFFYKSVYTEVVEALPINGGAYNCLLNGTSKTVAAIAGVTTLLSYVATAVISGKTALEYLSSIVSIPVIPATILLLLVFALLVISGLKDSAKVAFGIFTFHIVTLTVFVVTGLLFLFHGHGFFHEGIKFTSLHITNNGLSKALLFGFAASLLGVSGFESSANFVEEQQRGVFRKTLRNMLIGVVIFNPLIALIALNTTSIPAAIGAKDFILSNDAFILGGKMLQYLVVTDAFLVLSGAVLTAYVGVSGLMYRMSADACLPGLLSSVNSKGSYPKIVITFFVLCTSILLVTKGNLLSLAGVYTIAFLTVMSLFALGNLILRETRTELKRTYSAPILFVFLALLSTVVGVIGNILADPNNLRYFAVYFIPAVFIVLAIVFQDYNMRLLARLTKRITPIHRFITQRFEDMTDGRVVAFVNHVDKVYELLRYINRNETAWNITIVHCKNWDLKDDRDRHESISDVIPVLQRAGVFPYFKISNMYIDIPFGPEAIDYVSKKLKVRHNRIMIGSIHTFHDFDYSELHGVRIVF